MVQDIVRARVPRKPQQYRSRRRQNRRQLLSPAPQAHLDRREPASVLESGKAHRTQPCYETRHRTDQ